MDIRPLTLTANTAVQINQPGRVFLLVEAGSALDVTLVKDRSPVREVARGVTQGYKSKPLNPADPEDSFDAIRFLSTTNQTIRIGVSSRDADIELLLGTVAVEQPNAGTTTADQTVGAVQSTIAAANTSRKNIIVQNTHASNNIRVGIGTVTATRGLQLQPGMSATFVTTAAIVAIREGAADGTVAVVEMTRT